jgi:hypothetical protein
MEHTKRKSLIIIGMLTLTIALCIIIYTAIFKKSKSPYDINNDGNIGISDVTQLSLKIGQACANCPEDFNKDGIISKDDLNILLQNFKTLEK